jgi:tetratricopeptide (TPR) repeat protein
MGDKLMYKFNYAKMNRVLDDVKNKLTEENKISDVIGLFGGSIFFFEEALNTAENLDDKMITDYVNYFYRELYDAATSTGDLMLVCSVSDIIIDNLNKKIGKKKSNPYFNLMIDILILNAISLFQSGIVEGAKDYFTRATNLGEKYLNDSKVNYHDSLCCAINWLGYLSYQEENYKDSLSHCERIMELYNSVKDEDGFYYNEYDPIDVESKIEEIKKILNS